MTGRGSLDQFVRSYLEIVVNQRDVTAVHAMVSVDYDVVTAGHKIDRRWPRFTSGRQ